MTYDWTDRQGIAASESMTSVKEPAPCSYPTLVYANKRRNNKVHSVMPFHYTNVPGSMEYYGQNSLVFELWGCLETTASSFRYRNYENIVLFCGILSVKIENKAIEKD
ncbi:hypothetical protein EVAR_60543_1 [Eumeta japonica]|uniref:Uncharacterized protein n=1 Tax=Eumeta variegata TaxID=151549 RepID=A0A4C1YQJ0_EUMVA|nr:hypothetical protein EVAR_60543_1 [Eumeta japonica]